MRGEYYLTTSPVSTLSHMTEVTSGLASTSQLRLRLPTPASRTWLVTLEMLTLGTSDTRDYTQRSTLRLFVFALVGLTSLEATDCWSPKRGYDGNLSHLRKLNNFKNVSTTGC